MKKLLQTLYLTAALIGVTPAQADSYTYLCRDHHKTYPVVLNDPSVGEETCNGDAASCTITWHGTIYRNIKLGEDCRYNYISANDNGATIDLCTATKGSAGLTVGKKEYECQMPRR